MRQLFLVTESKLILGRGNLHKELAKEIELDTKSILNGGVFSTEANTVTTKKITGLESGTTYNIGVRAKYSISGADAYSFDTSITETTL